MEQVRWPLLVHLIRDGRLDVQEAFSIAAFVPDPGELGEFVLINICALFYYIHYICSAFEISPKGKYNLLGILIENIHNGTRNLNNYNKRVVTQFNKHNIM